MKTYVSGHNARGFRKPRVERPCKQCGATFSGTARAMKDRVFCAVACRDRFNREATGANNRAFTSLTMPCDICGTNFVTQPARLKNHQVYCSMECGREGRRRKISGKRRADRPFGKRIAKVRDRFACRICGFDLAVHAHHIVHRKNGGTNALSNLITLCPNHHAMAHAGLLDAETMTKAIAVDPQPVARLQVRAKHQINYRA